MTRQLVQTDDAPQNPSYSQAVKAGGLIFLSGQGPYDPLSGAMVGATIQEQTRQCLTNIEAILEAGGSGLDRIVSMTFILGDSADCAGMNEEWRRSVPERPSRSSGGEAPAGRPRPAVVDIRDRRGLRAAKIESVRASRLHSP